MIVRRRPESSARWWRPEGARAFPPDLRTAGAFVWFLGMLGALAIVLTAGIPGIILLAILVGLALRGRRLVEAEVRRASAVALVVLGWSIGGRFDRDVLASLAARSPEIGLALFAVLATAALMAFGLWRWFGFNARSAFVATAPGGLPELASVAEIGDIDLTSVLPVQMTRVVILLVLLPTALALLT